ncbi:MAG: carbohydrate-binding family 9-like protein [Anaerovoracaceae bacterium]
MKKYNIIQGKSAEADFLKAETAQVTTFPWNCQYQPITTAQMISMEDHFAIKMETNEKKPRIVVNELNGPVYTDSCMEFFFMPDPQHSNRYINWEFNPMGTLFISIGTNRFDRVNLDIPNYKELFNVKAWINLEGWGLEYKIPYKFLQGFFPEFSAKPGAMMRGNFYKCGDETEHPHYGVWADIDLPAPDFHSPDFFGTLSIPTMADK